MAVEYNEGICAELPNTAEYATQRAAAGCGESVRGLTDAVNPVINTAIGIVGLLAVIFIIVGGFQYVTSNGEASKVNKAKNTILYAVIGLVIALLAYAIVLFVVDKV